MSKPTYEKGEIISVKWNKNVELDVVEDLELDDYFTSCKENFTEGDTIEIMILEDKSDHIDIQFGDGSVVYHVNKDFFKEVK